MASSSRRPAAAVRCAAFFGRVLSIRVARMFIFVEATRSKNVWQWNNETRACSFLSCALLNPQCFLDCHSGRWKNTRTGRTMADNRHNPYEASVRDFLFESFVTLWIPQVLRKCERRIASSALTQARCLPAEVRCVFFGFACAGTIFCLRGD